MCALSYHEILLYLLSRRRCKYNWSFKNKNVSCGYIFRFATSDEKLMLYTHRLQWWVLRLLAKEGPKKFCRHEFKSVIIGRYFSAALSNFGFAEWCNALKRRLFSVCFPLLVRFIKNKQANTHTHTHINKQIAARKISHFVYWEVGLRRDGQASLRGKV